jgi:hypothetical protein
VIKSLGFFLKSIVEIHDNFMHLYYAFDQTFSSKIHTICNPCEDKVPFIRIDIFSELSSDLL